MAGGDRERGQDGPEGGYLVAGRFLGASDAALAASALEAAGIEARLRDQHRFRANQPPISPGVAGPRRHRPAARARVAAGLIAAR